jgi:hypothetical protein
MPEMWAQVPETEGGSCDCSDPVKEALCRDPNLRGLPPHELARAVGVDPIRAQRAIFDMAAQLTGRHVLQHGLSLDETLSIAGSPSRRKPIIQAPEAGAFEAGAIGDDRPGPVTVGGIALDPISIVVGVIVGVVGCSLLGSSSSGDDDDEEEDDDE